MWGGNMPNQFNHPAPSYASHQTATQSLGDGATASGVDFDTLLQSKVPLHGETPYGSAGYYVGRGVRIEPWSNTNQFNLSDQCRKVSDNDIEKYLFPGAIQGDNIPNSITDHTHMGLQPLNSSLFFEDAMLNFNKLIKLPLEEISTDPEKVSSMKNALSILADNFTSFPPEKGKKIVELLVEFAVLVPNWRGYNSQSQKYSLQFSAEKENIVATSGKNELRVRYEELEKKEKELITELETVKKEKAEIDKQMKEKEQLIMKIATAKLANLSAEWAGFQSFFI
ncbi:hypothetical protein AABB24_036365 [Solanum stoloniferum]|uniref:Uncharacterized protein n=1 Tax=Solanum stoloniferum TaxID=62892 RepID=A0ABD2RBQ2_9SOLN